jgi:hypothetical protein
MKLHTAGKYEGQDTIIKSTAFVSGHIKISQEEFDTHYIPLLDKAIEQGHKFVIGDANGVDAMAQKYLEQKGVTDITVYHMFTSPRNTVACAKLVGGFINDDSRDSTMTQFSTYDIAWVRKGKEKSGTQKNLDRREEKKTRSKRLLEKWKKVIDQTNKSPTAILIESQEHWMNPIPTRKSLNFETATPEELYAFFRAPPKDDPRWPKIGDKVKFLTAEGHFYPHYNNVIAYAKENLRMGEIYTVSKCEVYSSWCAVWLEGFGEHFFHFSMFEFPVDKDVNVV